MNNRTLPTSTTINGKICEFETDFRVIIEIFGIFNEPDLLDQEKIIVAMTYFYKTEDYLDDPKTAALEMIKFLNCGEDLKESSPTNKKPLYDWDQDFSIIIAPINKILGTDVRGMENLHWWTFISAFMEIGECTFNTYVGIRDKLNRGKKLEDHEERIYKDHIEQIRLKNKYDSVTQALIDEIMGKEV